MSFSQFKAAVIDLNNNTPNEGMRCIKAMLNNKYKVLNSNIDFDVFDARHKNEIPSLDYDIYISTGGPGSPLDGEGKRWELEYFKLLEKAWSHNQNNESGKKYFFFICHSFQIASRFFDYAQVTQRHSTAFGITYVHKTEEGEKEECFQDLANPFYVADFRDFQVVEADMKKLDDLGAEILTLEKERTYVDREQAITSVRFSNEMIGTQFHPEADAYGMNIHFHKPDKKKKIIDTHGEEKYHKLLAGLADKSKIERTHHAILPAFLHSSIDKLMEQRELVHQDINFSTM